MAVHGVFRCVVLTIIAVMVTSYADSVRRAATAANGGGVRLIINRFPTFKSSRAHTVNAPSTNGAS